MQQHQKYAVVRKTVLYILRARFLLYIDLPQSKAFCLDIVIDFRVAWILDNSQYLPESFAKRQFEKLYRKENRNLTEDNRSGISSLAQPNPEPNAIPDAFHTKAAEPIGKR